MHKTTLLAAGMLALVLSAAAARADEADCTPKLLSVQPLIAEPDGRYAVEVAINGAPHRLLLATSTVRTMFFQDFAQSAGMRQHEMPEHKFIFGFGGKGVGYAVADSVSIAGNIANGVQALVINSGYDADTQVVGTLGADLLSNFDLDIDFKADKLSLYASNPCDGKPVYWASRYADLAFSGAEGFAVPMTLDGKTLDVSLDTLVPHSEMRMDVANEYFGLTESSPGLVQTGTSREHRPIYRYTFGALAADGVSISKPVIALQGYSDGEHCNGKRHSGPGPVQGMVRFHICHNEGELDLGMQDLRPTHMYIAYKARRVYLTVASN